MSTVIDKISIEIESDAQGAYQGIENLAISLGKLKQNGSFGTAVKNLKNLKEALNGLNVNSSTMNDIRRLSNHLATLSTSFKGIKNAANTAGDGVAAFGKKSERTHFKLANIVTWASAAVSTFNMLANAAGAVMTEAVEWEGIEARFARGFGDKAQETYEWIQRLNEEMGINTQVFMQYSSIFSTMLQGFGVGTADAGKMALGYTELIYDIWAGYNDVYKNFGDAAEAVKSAIAGEVEPIRRAGFTIVEATLEQTAANHGLSISLEKATEAEKSYLRYLTLIDQARAQNLVGTYASEMDTAEGLMRTLAQQVKSLAQAFGSLFIPMLIKVLPYIQAFVDLIKDAIVAVGAFFGVDIQFADFSNYRSGIGGAADATDQLAESNNGLADSANKATKAAEDLKKATIGIDELNIISPPKEPKASGSGGKGSSGGIGAGFGSLPVDSLWDESIFDGIQRKVGDLKDKIKELLPIAAGIGLAIAGWKLAMPEAGDVGKLAKKFEALKKVVKTIGKIMAVAGIAIVVGKLSWDFTGAYLEGVDKNALMKAIGSTALGAGLAGFLAGEAGAGIVIATSGVVKLKRLRVELKEGSVKLSDPKALATMVVGVIETVLGGALVIDGIRGGKWIKAIAATVGTSLKKGLVSGVLAGDLWVGIAKDMVAPLATKITTALGGLGAAIAKLPGWVAPAVTAIVGTLILGFVDYDFTEVGYKFGAALAKFIGKPAIWIGNVGKALWNGINTAWKWLGENFTMENITAFLGKVFSVEFWTNTVWPWMKKIGGNIVSGLWAGITGWFNNLIGNIVEFCKSFVKGWEEELEIHSPSKLFERIGGFLIEGLWLGITGWFSKLISNVSTFVTNTINNVKKFFGITGNTSSNFKTIGSNLVQGVIDGIRGMGSSLWNSLKTWADGVIASVKGFFGIHSPSTVAKKEIGSNIVAGMVQGVTEKATALVKPIQTMWNNAKNWWNKSKGNLSFTPTIGNITKGLQSAWNSAKKWWSKNVKLSVPSIGLKVTYSNKGLNAVKKGIVKALSLPGWPSLKFAANGGMFDQGSLVWAGERGAEIVANAHGGKTGVMNVEQMQQAVYEGVLAAMAASQRGSSGSTSEIKVYLDGRQISASVERQQKERGVSIMGREVYSY